MSDLLRMTGMYSGMDTESVIQQLVQAKSQKVTNMKNDQKKLEWKQTLWQDLNKRIYKLYTGKLSNMRLTGSYAKKKTSISDPSKASIAASEGAVNGTQELEVLELAKADYLTGAVVSVKRSSYDTPIYDAKTATSASDGSDVTLADLGVGPGTLTVNNNSNAFNVTLDGSESIQGVIDKFNNAAMSAGSDMSMSYSEGKIQVKGPSDNSSYYMSTNGIAAGYKRTILQGLGLSNTCTADENPQGNVTGEAICVQGYDPGDFRNVSDQDNKYKSKVSDISPDLVGKKIRLTVGKGADAKITDVEITADMEIGQLTRALSEGGVNASFDEKNQRFFISAQKTGASNGFELKGLNSNGSEDNSVLLSLGLAAGAKYGNHSECTRIDAADAKIRLNGADFTSDSNTFTVNGLSITANAKTDDKITITTDTDYDGIYDMIKDFITEYNDIMNEMTRLYTADSARKYNMLSDEEKNAMTDDEVEKWETTIKDSLLRRDKDLNSVMECMRGAINKGYEIGGQTLYLVNFGIGTGSYFDTEQAERNALHIFGDSDDEKYSDQENDLKAAIAANPDQMIELFAAMSKDMYESLKKTMEGTDYRSIYKVYDDKRMKIEYDDYTKRIKEAEKKLNAYEDKWYKKFSDMEVALSKLQSNQNSLTSMLGQ